MPDDPNALKEVVDKETMKYICHLGYRYSTTHAVEQDLSCCMYTSKTTLPGVNLCQGMYQS